MSMKKEEVEMLEHFDKLREKQQERDSRSKLDKLKFWKSDEPKKFKAFILNTKNGTYETREVMLSEEKFEHNGSKYDVKHDAIYTHKPNPLKALIKKILPERKTSKVDLDTSDKVTGHILTPSRIVKQKETDSDDVFEYDDGIYDIGNVFTGQEGDLVLANKGDAIPKPETDKTPTGRYTDPSVALKERQFNLGILKKISQMPSGGFGFDLSSIPPWVIVLLFIIVILVLGGV